eukprot:3071534-Rhodomonas_salina.2
MAVAPYARVSTSLADTTAKSNTKTGRGTRLQTPTRWAGPYRRAPLPAGAVPSLPSRMSRIPPPRPAQPPGLKTRPRWFWYRRYGDCVVLALISPLAYTRPRHPV